METSAKTAANVMEIFTSIAKKLPKTESAEGGTGPRTGNNNRNLNLPTNEDARNSSSGCACK